MVCAIIIIPVLFIHRCHAIIITRAVPYGNYGCSGGNMYNSFMYVVANEGVDTESSYPYKGRVSVLSVVHHLHSFFNLLIFFR